MSAGETASTSAPITVQGTVSLDLSSMLPGELSATLSQYDVVNGEVVQVQTVPVDPGGRYRFAEVPIDPEDTFWVTVEYSGVSFESESMAYDANQAVYDLPVVLYESSEQIDSLILDQVHVMIRVSEQGDELLVTELYALSNPGPAAIVLPSNGNVIPFFRTPEGASDVRYQLADGSLPLLSADGGYALAPNPEKGYGIITTFSMPYENTGTELLQPFSLPVSLMNIFLPEGMQLQSEQLSDMGVQEAQGESYQVYQGEGLTDGISLSLMLSGNPDEMNNVFSRRQTSLVVGLGAGGLLLIALGIYLYLRDRSRSVSIKPGRVTSNPNPREGILDAILALDEGYEAGEISSAVYTKDRGKLKEKLKEALAHDDRSR